MTGDYLTKVFEGPYKNAPRWEKEMEVFVKSKGKQVKRTYFFLHDMSEVCQILR